jgi:type II secretory pathway component PulJ
MNRNKEQVQVALSKDEALVLFEWLASQDQKSRHAEAESAEQRVLWRVEGQLEKILPEILQPDYEQRVEASRRAVIEGG